MRDILVASIVAAGCLATFRWPWIGVMLWTWLSTMNPHRYTYGFAYSLPVAAAAAACVLLALMMTKERDSPVKGLPVKVLIVFMFWMTLSWLFGLDPAGDYDQWKQVMKIDGMLLVSLALLRTKQHILALIWVSMGSLALLGLKGGLFTIATGGGGRVWGPPGSFIADNNEFALALIMVVPMVRFLQLQVQSRKGRLILTATMLLCAISALGSQSRGALLAISAMAITLWWRSKGNKAGMAIALVLIAVPMIAFMPDEWSMRMSTINTYNQDQSAMGRIGAWWNSWNLAFHYPFGVGFNAARPELFAQYAPEGTAVLVAHSIYFQVLGHHGFVGLAIFITLWATTWASAGWLRKQRVVPPEAKWTADLGAMAQVSLVGYAIGGAFLSLAYMDIPYVLMAVVVLARVWVQKKAWLTEPAQPPFWKYVPGLSVPTEKKAS